MKYFLVAFLLLSSLASAQTKNIAFLKWSAPVARENAVALTSAEIGGYEISYKTKSANVFNKVLLVGGQFTSYDLELPTMEAYDIYLSAYDTKGLYSVSLKFAYTPETSPPKLKDFSVSQKYIDPQTTCTVELLCKVVKF